MSRIYPDKRNGKIIGYRSVIYDELGKRQRKLHDTPEEAQAYIDLNSIDPLGTQLLFENKDEVLFCIKRLKAVNSTVNEATNFFLEFGAKKTNPTIREAVDVMLADKRAHDAKPKYLDGLSHMYEAFLKVIGENTRMLDITTDQIDHYIHKRNLEWSPFTRNIILRSLNVLFNYSVKKHYIGINPAKTVDFAKENWEEPIVMLPEHFQMILDKCLRKKWYDRLVVFVLVGFCGVRKEEAAKLNWSNIDLKNKSMVVTATASKTGTYRPITIPETAMAWLNKVKDGRLVGTEAPIIGANWLSLMRSAIRYCKIDYDQNCIRHSFCSYAITAGWKKEDVIEAMGHTGPLTIKRHYRKLVEPLIAAQWWAIRPR